MGSDRDGGLQKKMPVHFDKDKARWRFIFRRRINRASYQFTKLLPQGWSRSQAEAYDRSECARIYAEATGITKPQLPLAGAVQLYLDHRVPELKNGKKAAQDLALLCDEIEAAALQDVGALALEYEKTHRGKLAPATIRNRLAYLKAAVRYAYKKHKFGDRDYSDGMSLPSPNNQRQFYAQMPELNRLWKALEPEARALFKMVFYMGLRWRSELLPRKPEDVIRNGRDTWLLIGHTKNGAPTMKPIHPAVIAELKYLPFTHSDSWFYDRWHEAVAKIERPELLPHDLRHSLASEIRARGGTLEDVQGALHQVSRQSAERYAHLYPTRLQGVILGIGSKNIAHRTPRAAGRKQTG
jgi:integrase